MPTMRRAIRGSGRVAVQLTRPLSRGDAACATRESKCQRAVRPSLDSRRASVTRRGRSLADRVDAVSEAFRLGGRRKRTAAIALANHAGRVYALTTET